MSGDPAKSLWHWEVRDRRRRSGWRPLAWMMSEDQAGTWARANCAQVRRLQGSREERQTPLRYSVIKAGAELRFHSKPQNK